LATACALAQRIDSVHVFQWEPDGKQTAASANRLVWDLHRRNAPHSTYKGEQMTTVSEAVAEYRPSKDVPVALPDLAHLAMVFAQGRRAAFGITEDLERLINLSNLSEYRISGWSQHLYVRTLLAEIAIGRR
jgi:hypothetical protein